MKRVFGALLNTCLIVISLMVVFILLEVSISIYQSKQEPETENIPLYILSDKPYLYGMNPASKRVNSHGLRDNEFSTEKPAGVFRILVLGDSIPYGRIVRSAWTFPNRLETLLNKNGYNAEVINAGVSGYTPYNELQYYLSEGRKFKANLVVLAFCMNDVVDPRLHWNFTQNAIHDIPVEAIPNINYDKNVIQPLIKARDESLSRMLNGSKSLVLSIIMSTKTYQFIASRLASIFPSSEQKAIQKKTPDLTKKIPTYITGEDDISIEVMTKPNTPEWQWLTGMYDQINNAVHADGIPLVVSIFPLAYQLDDAYPYFPQKLFASYCLEKELFCVDFLEPFKAEGKEKIFMLDKERGYDVWHLTAEGHLVSAEVLFEYLENNQLIKK